jgi:hypothetical protein
MVPWFIVACGGCASTPCDDALDKAQDDCGMTGVELNQAGEECGALAECQAKCILAASCADLMRPKADSALGVCLDACARDTK